MTRKKGKMNLYAITLQWTRIDDPAFEHILRTVGVEIRQAGARIDDAHASGNEEYADVVTDDECDVVENLLGLAYVLCQAQITRVVSGVIRLHERAKGETPSVTLTTTTGKKADILKFGSSAGPSPSPVEVLNALANYFKHESEWRRTDWSKLTGQAQGTAAVIQAAGASSGSTGNLRSGFEHLLGHADYEKVEALATFVTDWKAGLLAAYKAELKRSGLM